MFIKVNQYTVMNWRIHVPAPIYFIATFLQLQVTCVAVPIYENEDYKRAATDATLRSNANFGAIFGVICGICLILAIGACVCCDRSHLKFSWSRRRPRRVLRANAQNGFLTSGHEIAIFPPPGAEHYIISSTSNIHFEPLPDITWQLNGGTRTPRLSASVASNLNEDWFAEPYKNFPRNQLQYVRKLGSGWFGQVLEGRAVGVDTDHTLTVITKGPTSKATSVVVKALREDASPQEQALFLQELIPYRDLNHTNILKIVAYCIETQPLLVLLEYCPKGDLKSVLKRDRSLTDITLLKMAENVSAGLSHMHQHNFIHTDLAARNCVVENDLNVKIGDYGFSVETYQNEYYLAENVALPIRWCAPETLKCTETTIETIELTKAANVWSFGVLLWEIISRGKLPYDDLDEDGVIQKVILDRSYILRVTLHTHAFCVSKLNEMLDVCFTNTENRPFMTHLHSLLWNLGTCLNESSSDRDFEERWNQLSNNSRNIQQHNIIIADGLLDMRFESNFTPRVPLDKKGSPTPSLRNLHGSAEDLDARIAAKFGSALPSWLGLEPGQVMDSFTEEISDAIQRLDEALSEDRSESTTSVSSPEKTSFRLGSDSLVLNPPDIHRTLSNGDEENLTMRLEQGDFSELVRLKSQSVQDFMRLTVVDDGSDSDKTSQPGSLFGDSSVPSSRPQEKSFSSESNLKEAVRDAGFMVELERMQAEHKFSIISEASRDGVPSMEGVQPPLLVNPDSLRVPEERTQVVQSCSEEDDVVSALGERGNVDPENYFETDLGDEHFAAELQAKHYEFVQERCEASPDCVVSSRSCLSSAPLPDIVAHDNNLLLATSSDSSLDEGKTASALVSEDKFFKSLARDSEFNGGDTIGSHVSFHSPELKDTLAETVKKEKDFSLEHNVIMNDAKPNYSPEKVLLGEVIIRGLALEDYSLGPFKLKSNYTDAEICDDKIHLNENSDSLNISNQKVAYGSDNNDVLIFNSQNSEVESSVSPFLRLGDDSRDLESCSVTSTLSSIIKKEDQLVNPFKMNGLIHLKEEDENIKKEKLENTLTSLNVNKRHQEDLTSDRIDFNPFIEAAQSKHILPASESQNKCFSAQKEEASQSDSAETSISTETNSTSGDCKGAEPLLGKNSERDDSVPGCSREETEAGWKLCLEAAAIHDPFQNLPSEQRIQSTEAIAESSDAEMAAAYTEMKSGEFWERQMVAWQEAAEQTRALLHAAHKEEAIVPRQGSEEDLLDTNRIPGSSQKSTFSSTDRLDDTDDDDGTYVSYDTTDDDDAVRFNHDDIMALRSKLHLKLPDVGKDQESLSDEEVGHDHVFINYKSGCALSPIKEEDHQAEFFEVEGENSSIEFTEGTRADCSIVVPPLVFGDLDGDTTEAKATLELSAEETKDSLILEDLECEGTTPATTIIGPIVPAACSEDLLLVDTETNQATLIDSGRPQSHIAFQIEKQDRNSNPLAAALPFDVFDDDVASESLPYEDTSGLLSSNFQKMEDSPVDNPVHDVEIREENEAPHYQSYFTSALSSISHPTPSLEGNDAFESADHVSLPYEVNLPLVFLEGGTLEQFGKENDLQVVPSSEDSPANTVEPEKEALILDAPSNKENAFVTLSFLGRLYSAEDSMSQHESNIKNDLNSGKTYFVSTRDGSIDQSSSMEYYSTKSETDSSDNEMIEEDLPSDSTSQRLGIDTPTPIRTPSHLADYVWRENSGEDPRYTPDWETDSEGNEDMESSSTSGEFIWQPGDPCLGSAVSLPSTDNTSLEWQLANEKKEEDQSQSQCSPLEDDSESGEEEFTPSIWNRDLTPNRSLLKSPETNSGEKKSVHWKRQRHHRVYEYPPEPQSWHAEVTAPRPRRSWGSHSLDYLTLADWELGGDEFLGDDSEDFEEFFPKGNNPLSAPQIYSLGPLAYNNSHEDFYSDGCSFFMSPSGSSYAFSSSSFTPAEFFPDENSARNYDFVYTEEKQHSEEGEETSELSQPQDIQMKNSPEEAKLSREKLRLDLPTLCLAETQVQDRENENL